MSVADNYLKIRSALTDGPLAPAELKAATGLSRHQIYRASLMAMDLAIEIREMPALIYSAQHNLYMLTHNGVEIARAMLPRVNHMITMCNHTLPTINMVLQHNPNDEKLLAAKTLFEKHKLEAELQKEMLEKMIEEAE